VNKGKLKTAAKIPEFPFLGLVYEAGTTMNSILAFVRLLQFGGNGFNEEQKKYFEDISHSAEHFFEVIEFLTDIIKMQQNALEVYRTNTEIQLFIHRLFTNTPAFAFRRRVEYSCDIQPDIGEIEVDQNKMTKILKELVENMIRFTEQDHRAGIHAMRENGDVRIRVWNDSAPLTREIIDQLFLPQIHNSYTPFTEPVQGKIDMGFLLAQRIIELHRGTLSVENGTPKGTTVTITLPASGTGI